MTQKGFLKSRAERLFDPVQGPKAWGVIAPLLTAFSLAVAGICAVDHIICKPNNISSLSPQK